MSAFLYIDGVPGEVSDVNFKGWLDIRGWGWGTQRNITSNTSTQGNRESANAVITDLTIRRSMDKATPKLFIETCCGRGKEVKLVQTKTGTGNGADIFIEYTFHNALISNYQVVANANNPARPIEELTISFVELDVKYTQYDEDGNAEAPIAVGFNTATNIKK
ncbi:MAG: Hcp family type VI secretion system effector [Cellvibrionaceae bacterium]